MPRGSSVRPSGTTSPSICRGQYRIRARQPTGQRPGEPAWSGGPDADRRFVGRQILRFLHEDFGAGRDGDQNLRGTGPGCSCMAERCNGLTSAVGSRRVVSPRLAPDRRCNLLSQSGHLLATLGTPIMARLSAKLLSRLRRTHPISGRRTATGDPPRHDHLAGCGYRSRTPNGLPQPNLPIASTRRLATATRCVTGGRPQRLIRTPGRLSRLGLGRIGIGGGK